MKINSSANISTDAKIKFLYIHIFFESVFLSLVTAGITIDI